MKAINARFYENHTARISESNRKSHARRMQDPVYKAARAQRQREGRARAKILKESLKNAKPKIASGIVEKGEEESGDETGGEDEEDDVDGLGEDDGEYDEEPLENGEDVLPRKLRSRTMSEGVGPRRSTRPRK